MGKPNNDEDDVTEICDECSGLGEGRFGSRCRRCGGSGERLIEASDDFMEPDEPMVDEAAEWGGMDT